MTSDLLCNKLKTLLHGSSAVIVCVGSDLFGGDCVGPLTGHFLIESDIKAYVYGTLKSPVTALNVNKTGEFVKQTHPHSKIIAVDSMVGSEVGKIEISGDALAPGAALGKKLNAIGDICITAVTTPFSPRSPKFSAVRLSLIYSLAKSVADIIKGAIDANDRSLFKCVSF